MALTKRQQQITDLLDQGKTPSQIAKALKITENAVYQHSRRIKQANGAAAKPKRKTARKPAARKATTRKPARKPARRTRPSTRRPTPKPELAALAGTIKPTTPLQAIRARRDEIGSGLKELLTARDEAQKALDGATKRYEDAHAKQSAELLQLDAAESALTGKVKATKPRRQSSRKAPAKPAQEAPAAPQAPAAPDDAPVAENGSAPEAPVNDATPAVRDDNGNVIDTQAALDAGAEFEEIADEPVGVAVGDDFEQPDGFGDEE